MDAVEIAIITAGATVIGGVLGFLGSLVAARYHRNTAKDLADHNDRLERRREFDREDRAHKWALQRLEAERRLKPALGVTFDRNSGLCLYPFSYGVRTPSSSVILPGTTGAREEQRTDWYVSVLVRNEGGSAARNCVGLLTKLERLHNGIVIEEPIHGPLLLRWANDEHPLELPISTEKPLNVFVAHEPNDPLDVQLRNLNSKLVESAMAKIGNFRFTIQVSCDDAQPQEIRLCVNWDGTWDGATWPADRIWVE